MDIGDTLGVSSLSSRKMFFLFQPDIKWIDTNLTESFNFKNLSAVLLFVGTEGKQVSSYSASDSARDSAATLPILITEA